MPFDGLEDKGSAIHQAMGRMNFAGDERFEPFRTEDAHDLDRGVRYWQATARRRCVPLRARAAALLVRLRVRVGTLPEHASQWETEVRATPH